MAIMAQITIQVSDELVEQLQPFRDRLPEVLERGLGELSGDKLNKVLWTYTIHFRSNAYFLWIFQYQYIFLLQLCLGDRFHYFAEYPLEKICQRPPHCWLDKDDWKFLVNSRVDIAMMERDFGTNRKASLVVECQFRYHDNPEAQERDRRKAHLLKTVGVPLIYVRQVPQDPRFYRFYTPDDTEDVFYNIVTQENRDQIEILLQNHQRRWCEDSGTDRRYV